MVTFFPFSKSIEQRKLKIHDIQEITNEPEEFTSLKGATIQRKISVEAVSFSAHVDFSQNSEFIEQVGAQHVVSFFFVSSVRCKNMVTCTGPGSRRTDGNASIAFCYEF